MPTYQLEARYLIQQGLQALDKPLLEDLWSVFKHIAKHWTPDITMEEIKAMRSSFDVFISNRIEQDSDYLNDYRNAVDVVLELAGGGDDAIGVEKLITSSSANAQPPVTRLARARQFVSNEFVHLFLSLGGFKKFGSPLNFPGYIGGGNFPGSAPYLTYTPAP